jgi:hypothetical protein
MQVFKNEADGGISSVVDVTVIRNGETETYPNVTVEVEDHVLYLNSADPGGDDTRIPGLNSGTIWKWTEKKTGATLSTVPGRGRRLRQAAHPPLQPAGHGDSGDGQPEIMSRTGIVAVVRG